MDKIKLLKQIFREVKPTFSKEILKFMSSKTDEGEVFPPYIPFIGKKYDRFKIIVYATAQNIGCDNFRKIYQDNFEKLVERLYYFDDFRKKYPNNEISFQDIPINPYRTGVIPALIGVFLYVKFGVIIEDLNEINHLISISRHFQE